MDSFDRSILHLDLDAFFVAVEQLRNDSLKGKPLLIGGSSTFAGTILSDYLGGGQNSNETGGHIGPVSIGRDFLGGSDTGAGTINVTGRVEHALIHAGIDTFGSTNADAQIGTVTVGGDWIASSLVAGAQAGDDGQFGTQDDGKFAGAFTKDVAGVYSCINSVVIGGQVLGTEFTGDHFGIVAESVGSLSINANLIPLLVGKHNDDILLAPLIDGFFGDLRLREI